MSGNKHLLLHVELCLPGLLPGQRLPLLGLLEAKRSLSHLLRPLRQRHHLGPDSFQLVQVGLGLLLHLSQPDAPLGAGQLFVFETGNTRVM